MKSLSDIMGSPGKVYRWSIAAFVAWFFLIPLFFLKKTGYEDLFIRISLLTLIGFAAVMLILSIVTSLVYWPWFKKYWYINLIVFICTLLILLRLYHSDTVMRALNLY